MLRTSELPSDHFSFKCATKNCALVRLHRRVQEAHRLWHQTADHYSDPDAFTSYLNTTIQSLRNVTFILQACKSRIPDFDSWYEPWRDRFKADPIMVWLRDARNAIVKQDDLATFSKARCKVLTGWGEPPVFEIELDAKVPTKLLAEMIATRTTFSDEVLKAGAVVVERRWVEQGLPNEEVLSALAYSYSLIAAAIDHLHESSDLRGAAASQQVVRIPCMDPSDFDRTVVISIATGDELIVKEGKWELLVNLPPGAVEKRYKFSRLPDMPGPTAPLRDRALHVFAMAKRIIEKDGYHRPIVLYFTEDGKYAVTGFDMADRAEILVAWRVVAMNVRKMKAIAIISVYEGWLAQVPEDGVVRMTAEESPDRREILQVHAVSRDGEEYSFHAEMNRRWGKLRLGPMEEWEKQHSFYLNPVRAVWKESPTSS